MKNSTIRLIFILALVLASGIIVTQVYWVRSAYHLTEQEFNLNVNISLREVAEKLWQEKGIEPQVSHAVERVSPECYMVHVGIPIDPVLLEKDLRNAFIQNKVVTSFGFAIYGSRNGNIQYKKYARVGGSIPQINPELSFPVNSARDLAFAVYFPHRKAFYGIQLQIWTITSVILLGVIGFMAYIVFMILRQKRLSEVQRDFVNNMTHEFKTPLATIQIAAEVLQKPDIVKEPLRLLNYATIIDKEAKNLTQHVEKVLSVVRAEKIGLQLTREKIDWAKMFEDIRNSFAQKLKQHNGQIIVNLPRDTPSFNGDYLHIKNLFSNLIDNSIKYCHQAPVIRISMSAGRHNIKIKVEDNGIGIKEEDQKRIFEKFFRVNTGNVHDVKGFGLGLNYVRTVVHAHDGRILCDSKVGKGTTFTILLPKNDKEAYQ